MWLTFAHQFVKLNFISHNYLYWIFIGKFSHKKFLWDLGNRNGKHPVFYSWRSVLCQVLLPYTLWLLCWLSCWCWGSSWWQLLQNGQIYIQLLWVLSQACVASIKRSTSLSPAVDRSLGSASVCSLAWKRGGQRYGSRGLARTQRNLVTKVWWNSLCLGHLE